MSAFMCTDKHISVLANFAAQMERQMGMGRPWPHRVLDTDRAAVLGALLHAANARSMAARYPRDTHYGDSFRYAAAHIESDPVVILKLIACFEYQSCEFEEWRESEAFTLCQKLRTEAVHLLPGFDAAPWGI